MYFRSRKKYALDVSFSEPIEQDGEGNPLTLMDIVAEDDTILEELAFKQNKILLYRFLTELEDRREREVLILRYGLNGQHPLTQSEVASRYGISRSYVSRIETKALKKLRDKFNT